MLITNVLEIQVRTLKKDINPKKNKFNLKILKSF